MESRSLRDGGDRYGRRKNHARPDRIIEKRPSWQDYLDPEEDPGLLDEEDSIEAGDVEEPEGETEDARRGVGPGGCELEALDRLGFA